MERKKIVRIAMRITEAIIGILKDEFGEKMRINRSKTKKVRKTSRTICLLEILMVIIMDRVKGGKILEIDFLDELLERSRRKRGRAD